jgi:hypothetical protein
MNDYKSVRLFRNTKWPQLCRAVLRKDGVHFYDYEGAGFTEREEADYPSIDAMNMELKRLGFEQFEVVTTREWPRVTKI